MELGDQVPNRFFTGGDSSWSMNLLTHPISIHRFPNEECPDLATLGGCDPLHSAATPGRFKGKWYKMRINLPESKCLLQGLVFLGEEDCIICTPKVIVWIIVDHFLSQDVRFLWIGVVTVAASWCWTQAEQRPCLAEASSLQHWFQDVSDGRNIFACFLHSGWYATLLVVRATSYPMSLAVIPDNGK